MLTEFKKHLAQRIASSAETEVGVRDNLEKGLTARLNELYVTYKLSEGQRKKLQLWAEVTSSGS